MRMQKLRTWMFGLVLLTGLVTQAADINSIVVQGYVRATDGSQITGSQTVTFVLASGGSTIKTWAGETVNFSNGVFSAVLTGISAGEIASFASSSGGAVSVTVSSTTGAFASTNLSLPMTSGSVPTALQAASLHSSAKATTSAGAADVGKAVILDAAGKIDSTMLGTLPAISGANLTSITATNISGTVPAANLPTAGAAAAGVVDTGAQTFAGAKTFNGAVAAGSTLAVTGAVTAGSTLAVTGAVTAGSTVDVTGALTVTGVSNLNGGAKFASVAPGNGTLSHYEDSTTCTLTPAGLTAAGTYVQSAQVCRYYRVGKLVTINAMVNQTSLTGATGGMVLNGLPYAAANLAGFEQACTIVADTTVSNPTTSHIAASITPAETRIRLYTKMTSTPWTKAALVADTGTAALTISCSYFVD